VASSKRKAAAVEEGEKIVLLIYSAEKCHGPLEFTAEGVQHNLVDLHEQVINIHSGKGKAGKMKTPDCFYYTHSVRCGEDTTRQVDRS
jgi:hypothetical protein